DARLCLTIIRTAAAHGAIAVNQACVTRFSTDPTGRVNGAFVSVDGHDVAVRARSVINATGVWSDAIRKLDDPGYTPTIRPAKGIHITVPTRRIGADTAVVIPVRSDKRSMFIIPNGDFTFVGTTDTDYGGPIDDPQCTSDDIDYVLTALNDAITTDVTRDDIVGTWAGLRPLVSGAAKAKTADLSRRHAVSVSSSGVITVTGGKLTTYRKMADDAVSAACEALDVKSRCVTTRRKLLGAAGFVEPTGGGVDAHLLRRYGTEAAMLRALIVADRSLADPLVPGLPYVRAEAVHACRHEMATTVDDVLSRRTRARLLGADASCQAADAVAAVMAPHLGWSSDEQARQGAAYRASVAHEQAWRG
ncbi:MAG: glycerol-3-phosphate dehydrogenase/oxidase, partial [Acidimicrobiia bacterium]